MIHIAFTGHRNCLTEEYELENLLARYPDSMWHQGGAMGFDFQVFDFARRHGIGVTTHPPKYNMFPLATRKWEAPHARNREMVDLCDFLVACYDGRKNGGTKYTVDYALSKGKRIEFVVHFHT